LFRKAKKVEDILDIGQLATETDDYYDHALYDAAYADANAELMREASELREQYNARVQVS
jgi:hypothetical protein